MLPKIIMLHLSLVCMCQDLRPDACLQPSNPKAQNRLGHPARIFVQYVHSIFFLFLLGLLEIGIQPSIRKV